jgi:hypothetical protein
MLEMDKSTKENQNSQMMFKKLGCASILIHIHYCMYPDGSGSVMYKKMCIQITRLLYVTLKKIVYIVFDSCIIFDYLNSAT